MENMMSLEEAVRRIEELEKENAQLRVQFGRNWSITEIVN